MTIDDEKRLKNNYEDLVLIEKSLKGDKESFSYIVKKYQTKLFAHALSILKNREDAQDAVQNTFIKAYTKLASFHNESSFSTWLYKICMFTSIDIQRSKKRNKTNDLELIEFGASIATQHESSALLDENKSTLAQDLFVINNETQERIIKALSELSDAHRVTFILREVDEFSYEEIAEILDVKIGTVMSRLFHARKEMQKILYDLKD